MTFRAGEGSVEQPQPECPLDLTYWQLTFAGLLVQLEECVADLAQMREDDPTRPGLVEDYANASRALREHVDALIANQVYP